MAKKRIDLRVEAYRIDNAIAAGRADALPVYPKPGFTLGRKPRLMVLFSSLRLRLRPVNDLVRQRFERRYGKKWDNRMTIPPCLLNSRWILVTEKADDFSDLCKMTVPERKRFGVVTKDGEMKRRIYEVVEDFSHGLRQIDH